MLVAEAQRLGFRLEPAAARILVDRMGANPVRLRQRAGAPGAVGRQGGAVTGADLEEMIADTSEAAVWSLSDALLEGDAATALRIGERLIAQGENVTGLIYGLASRLRGACAAAAQLEEGIPPKQVESSLKMHPYAAKQLVARLRNADLADLRAATETLADLELWCRGGADYGDELALTLALRRAAGAERLTLAAVPAAMRAALAFLRAPVFLCRAPFCTALSIFETRSRCSAGDRLGVARLDRAFQAPEVGLHGAGQQPILGALALAA